MIKLYIKKNPNELAELTYPKGLLTVELLDAFRATLCTEHKNCDNCNFCSGGKGTKIPKYYDEIFKYGEFYAGKFPESYVVETIDLMKKYAWFNIKPYLRIEE